MLQITHADASAAILAACDAGTLVQGKWHDRSDDGREIACLLGSMHPDVQKPADCNGDLMPMWLAALIVGVVVLVVGGVLAWVGYKRLKTVNPLPERTIDTLREDVEWLHNQRL